MHIQQHINNIFQNIFVILESLTELKLKRFSYELSLLGLIVTASMILDRKLYLCIYPHALVIYSSFPLFSTYISTSQCHEQFG